MQKKIIMILVVRFLESGLEKNHLQAIFESLWDYVNASEIETEETEQMEETTEQMGETVEQMGETAEQMEETEETRGQMEEMEETDFRSYDAVIKDLLALITDTKVYRVVFK